MLIEFRVTNFRSFKDEQKFSLVRGTGDELLNSNSFTANDANQLPLLRSAAIYGPNASGKSNFLRGLQTMQKLVVNSAQGQRGELLAIASFRLSSDFVNEPTEFEATFIVEGVRYQYGFSATQQRIEQEWLYAFPKKRAQTWFQRAWNSDSEQFEWELGNQLQGGKSVWQKSTRDNALFLSTAVQLNSRQLMPLFDWFKEYLKFPFMDQLNTFGIGNKWRTLNTSDFLRDENNREQVLDFLQAADLSITDLSIEELSLSELANKFDLHDAAQVIADIAAAGVTSKKEQLPGLELVHIQHKSEDGSSVKFDLLDESDGTQKLLTFAGPWISTLKQGGVLVIDELHDNLHPKLVLFLVGLFNNSGTNPKNAQLIFTTHETSMLNQDVFRRDQVWFCESHGPGGSQLYPLTDFSPRKGRENLELSYLSGRYGALPFVRDLNLQ